MNTPAPKRTKKCAEAGCTNVPTAREFCRLHYIKNWREIVRERREKAREKLNRYVESIAEKYPEGYMDILESDLADAGALKRRLHEFGFREEFEEGEKNPFEATEIKELLEDMEVGEDAD